jgi:hypothetical protein
MSWIPPKSFGAVTAALNAPLEFVVAVASTTPILSTFRPR